MKITIPTDWNGVTLREYQAYHDLLKESETKREESTNKEVTDFEIKCAIVSLFSGVEMNLLLIEERYRIEHLINMMGFLSHPITGKVKTKCKVNGTRYYFEKKAKKISGGQWISLQHFLQDPEKIDENLHNLLACFAYRRKWFKKTHEADKHEQTAEDMKELPMTIVKPLTDFFLSDWETSVTSTLRFLEIVAQRLKRKAEKELARSSANTDGSTQSTTSRMEDLNFGTITST